MRTARSALDRSKIFGDALQSRINALSNDFVNRDDPAQRAQYYNQVDQQLATNDVTVIPLFQKPTQLGYRDTIKGMVDNPTQDGFTWNIEDWTYSG